MTDLALPLRDRAASTIWQCVAIAVGLAVAGFIIRFLAFRVSAPDADPTQFLGAMCRWDCQWYVELARNGYDGFPTPKLINAGNWAFFPLYPAIVGGLAAILPLPILVWAAIVGTLVTIGSTLLALPLLGHDRRAFTLFAAFMLCGPFSFYFTSFFTETLFVFLTLAVFAALQARRFLLAGILAGALSATRIVGVFIVFAILWEVWRAHREAGGTWRTFIPALLGRPDLLLAFAIAPVGLFAYMAYLHFLIGDALAFQHVQRAWGRPFGLPPIFIWNGLTSFPAQGLWPTPSQWLGFAAVVGYALTIGLFLTRRIGMGIYAGISLTLPLFAGLASMTRFVTGMAPLPLLAADLAGRTRIGFVIGMLVLIAGAWFVTLAWLGENIALV